MGYMQISQVSIGSDIHMGLWNQAPWTLRGNCIIGRFFFSCLLYFKLIVGCCCYCCYCCCCFPRQGSLRCVLWQSWCAPPRSLGQFWGKFGIIIPWVLKATHLLLSPKTFHPCLCQLLHSWSPLETLGTSEQKFTRLDGILKIVFFMKRKDSSPSQWEEWQILKITVLQSRYFRIHITYTAERRLQTLILKSKCTACVNLGIAKWVKTP